MKKKGARVESAELVPVLKGRKSPTFQGEVCFDEKEERKPFNSQPWTKKESAMKGM